MQGQDRDGLHFFGPDIETAYLSHVLIVDGIYSRARATSRPISGYDPVSHRNVWPFAAGKGPGV